jgi:hypothetical protein
MFPGSRRGISTWLLVYITLAQWPGRTHGANLFTSSSWKQSETGKWLGPRTFQGHPVGVLPSARPHLLKAPPLAGHLVFTIWALGGHLSSKL